MIVPSLGFRDFVYGLHLLGYFGYGQLSWHLQLMFFGASLIGYRNTLEWKQKGLYKYLWEDEYKDRIVIAQGLSVLCYLTSATIILSMIYGIAGILNRPRSLTSAGFLIILMGVF